MRGASLRKLDAEPWRLMPGNTRVNPSLFAHLWRDILWSHKASKKAIMPC